MKNILAAILAMAFAMFASAADFAVPQGGGKLPTIALVECFAAENSQASGQYCRATYDCAGDTGVLWEGLANHNGRRVTLETDPISNQRDCVLKVDDTAKVQFFTGYRPAGRTGEVVALVRSGTSAVTVAVNTMETPSPNMLEQFLFAVQYATLQDWIDYTNTTSSQCSRHGCREVGAMLTTVPATDRTRCYVEQEVARATSYVGQILGALARAWSDQRSARANLSDGYDCNELPHV